MKINNLGMLAIGLALLASCSGTAREDRGCAASGCAVLAAGQSSGSGQPGAIRRRGDPDVLRRILASDPVLRSYFPEAAALRLQVIYTQIDRGGEGGDVLTTYGFREDAQPYNPASLSKLPVALLTLEKLNKLGLDRDDRLEISGNNACNSYLEDGCATPGQCIERMFVLSDNDAFNRLYEFLGSDYINRKMDREKGYHGFVTRRFRRGCGAEAGSTTATVSFYDRSNRLVYRQQPIANTGDYPAPLAAERAAGGTIASAGQGRQPPSITGGNYFPLSDFHEMLMSVAMPQAVPPQKRLRLREEDRAFLLRSMSMLPREYGSDQPDSFRKWLMLGTDHRMPANLRIYNKVGLSGGFVTDVAYITDPRRNLEFFLSATIFVNDGDAGYRTRAFPFMKALGQAIYRHEFERRAAELPGAHGPTHG